jgi:hypothetical protein
MLDIDSDETAMKRICHFCISEQYLSSEVRTLGSEAKCDYCGKSAASMEIGELAERIEEAFTDHYERTADQPDSWQMSLQNDRESTYNWTREGMPVGEAIQDAAGIDEEPAGDILAVLDDKHAPAPSDYTGDESEFSPDSCYQRKHSI